MDATNENIVRTLNRVLGIGMEPEIVLADYPLAMDTKMEHNARYDVFCDRAKQVLTIAFSKNDERAISKIKDMYPISGLSSHLLSLSKIYVGGRFAKFCYVFPEGLFTLERFIAERSDTVDTDKRDLQLCIDLASAMASVYATPAWKGHGRLIRSLVFVSPNGKRAFLAGTAIATYMELAKIWSDGTLEGETEFYQSPEEIERDMQEPEDDESEDDSRGNAFQFVEEDEMFRFAFIMYYILNKGVDDWEKISGLGRARRILAGKRPALVYPEYVSGLRLEMENVLNLCWAQEPSTRPSFAELHRLLIKLQDTPTTH